MRVVEFSRSGEKATQRIVRCMAIELDAEEETKLRAPAEEFISRSLTERLKLMAR